MAQQADKKNTKDIIKIAAVVVLFGAIGFLVFNNFINKPDSESTVPPRRAVQLTGAPGQQVNAIEDLQNMQLYLDSLEKFGSWPVEFNFELVSGNYGRSNPFLPLN